VSSLLLAPHADDETLFAFYALLRDGADVLVCLEPGQERRQELEAAMKIANRGWAVLEPSQPEKNPDWTVIGDAIWEYAQAYETIIAPAFEGGGHEHHNCVAAIAATLAKPVTAYYTYERGQARTARGMYVVASAAERVLKRRAMDCYKSQIAREDTAPWFKAGWQVEYVELPS
jgi:LmbE family N-acetylglucosaminyl deacetylase